MHKSMLIASAMIGLGSALSPSVYSDEPAAATKATFVISGLHCPPCTATVQNSLTRVKGVKSVSVDWNTKNAKVEFDESVLPAQALAAAIDSTPHMMGAGMRYSGWLALKVPAIKDDASGQKAKDVLSKVEGVSKVVVYPSAHSAVVQFAGKGTLTSRKLTEALAKEGIEATNF